MTSGATGFSATFTGVMTLGWCAAAGAGMVLTDERGTKLPCDTDLWWLGVVAVLLLAALVRPRAPSWSVPVAAVAVAALAVLAFTSLSRGGSATAALLELVGAGNGVVLLAQLRRLAKDRTVAGVARR